MTPIGLQQYFDVVVMLTWSNWNTEPRSNRYHYATRFAAAMPVLFVQPKFMDPGVEAVMSTPLQVERSDTAGITIVHYDQAEGDAAANELMLMLLERGFRRPLVWIYNGRDFSPLLARMRQAGNALFVFHATENYFTTTDAAPGMQQNIIADLVRDTCREVDLVVGVSEYVTEAYRAHAPCRGGCFTVENGCDFGFAQNRITGRLWQEPARPVAIYQGGINSRLDFGLLHQLVHELPDWEFRFCGREDVNLPEWRILKTHPNVRYLGELGPEELADRVFEATVGLIPFVQDQWIRESMPLKSFEYLSFGLPVVTVPIGALARYPGFFLEARNAAEFAEAMREAAQSRSDPAEVASRMALAENNSYDRRFEEIEKLIIGYRVDRGRNQPPLNMVILYDERWTHISTIHEHMDAFRKYSRHNVHFLPATGVWPGGHAALGQSIDLSLFDVIVVHYSVRLRFHDYFTDVIAAQVERHHGMKILFIQDEYEDTEIARQWMERLRFTIVYTCVPEKGRDRIYPPHRFPGTEFLSTLTGYVPETGDLDRFALPLSQRPLHIAYRGRMLPYIYGELGNEKYRIGVDVRRFAEERFLPVDIEVDDTKRIYGDDWYRFLGSARSTLGTESGSGVFDFTGEAAKAVAAELKRNPGATFEEVRKSVLHRYEGPVEMNQISPKIFEAIRLRTALVLFEGSYSGVVQPWVHFIPLKKDYSNIDEVFAKLEDLDFLRDLTDRAFRDVIESGRYSYRQFVEGVDADIAARHLASPQYEIVSVPVFARRADGSVRSVLPGSIYGFTLTNRLLGGSLQREQVGQLMAPAAIVVPAEAEIRYVQVAAEPDTAPLAQRRSLARRLWHLLPEGSRHRLAKKGFELMKRHRANEDRSAADYRIYRRVFRSLPFGVRTRLIQVFNQ